MAWHIPTPGRPEIPLIESLPRLANAIATAREESGSLPDFALFDWLLKGFHVQGAMERRDEHALLLSTELRHYLCAAYSHFQAHVDKAGPYQWPWQDWMRTHAQSITMVVSFNYDLIAERLLVAAGLRIRGFAMPEETTGLLVLKPHGSIDFEVHERAMGSPPATYPISNWLVLCDFFLKRLTPDELLRPRKYANIVIPSEASPMLNVQWIRPGYEYMRSMAQTWTHCVVVGLSYWACDRGEIDFVLASLSPSCHVVVANPDPPPALLEAIRSRGLKLSVWPSDPQAI